MRPSKCKQAVVKLLTGHNEGMTIGVIARRTGYSYKAVAQVVRYDIDFVVVPQPEVEHRTVGQAAKVYALAPKREPVVMVPVVIHHQYHGLLDEQATLVKAMQILTRRGRPDEAKMLLDAWREGDETFKKLINGDWLPNEDEEDHLH